MRQTLRDIILTAVTLGVAFVALVAGATFQLGLLFIALFVLWMIGNVFVWMDD